MSKRARTSLEPTASTAAYPRREPGGSAPPSVPQKTMGLPACQIDGIPDVGWVVPMNGPCRLRTFDLLEDRNIIGSAASCEVSIPDPRLSPAHAEIRHSAAGFRLVALVPAGVSVNNRVVAEHDLVDNESFQVGGIEFRFKTSF